MSLEYISLICRNHQRRISKFNIIQYISANIFILKIKYSAKILRFVVYRQYFHRIILLIKIINVEKIENLILNKHIGQLKFETRKNNIAEITSNGLFDIYFTVANDYLINMSKTYDKKQKIDSKTTLSR